jgi:hypothetical protein
MSEDRLSGHVNAVGIRLYSSRGWMVCFRNNAIGPGQYPWSMELGRDYWLAPDDSRLRFTSPATFFSNAATSHISIPHGIVILLSGALAALSWLRWKFSLRTLLIATTIIGLILGILIATRR